MVKTIYFNTIVTVPFLPTLHKNHESRREVFIVSIFSCLGNNIPPEECYDRQDSHISYTRA